MPGVELMKNFEPETPFFSRSKASSRIFQLWALVVWAFPLFSGYISNEQPHSRIIGRIQSCVSEAINSRYFVRAVLNHQKAWWFLSCSGSDVCE